MKKILFPLLLIGMVAYGQQSVVTIQPYLSTQAIVSCVTLPGSASISATAKPFGSVTVGMPVYGVGVPANTVVLSLPNPLLDSVIILSNAMTQGGTKTLSFGYQAWTSYATGDWLGLPFQVYNTGEGGTVVLVSASVSDNSDLLGNTDIIFFSEYSDTLGCDSLAVVIPATESYKVLGIIALTTAVDVGGVRILNANNIQMAVPRHRLWARLISRATVTSLPTVQPYTVRLGFR